MVASNPRSIGPAVGTSGMDGGSRESYATLLTRVDQVLGTAAAVDAASRSALAADLFAVVDLLGSSSGLRRALADPAMPAAARSQLITGLLGSQVSPEAAAIIADVAAARWPRPTYLIRVLELLGLQVLLGAAEADSTLEDVEDELFRFARVVASESSLSLALSDPALPLTRKVSLVEALLDGKAAPSTIALVVRTVAARRGLPIERALAELAELAAARRRRSLATVRAAVPLTDEQIQRLTAALNQMYQRSVDVAVEVDPAVVGGLVVQVGDEVVDGSIARRLVEAARQVVR